MGEVATTVTMSPTEAPGIEISGVLSDVTLSVADDPVSDTANRSGADVGAAGGVVSTEMSSPGPAADTLPAGSATVAATFHAPSANVPRSQLVTDEDFTYVHVTFALPGFDAVIVTVLPSGTAPADIAGVLSLVLLSVDDAPRSDAVTRSGADGADGADVSIDNDNADDAAEVFPARSVWVADTLHVPSTNVPRSHDVAGRT